MQAEYLDNEAYGAAAHANTPAKITTTETLLVTAQMLSGTV